MPRTPSLFNLPHFLINHVLQLPTLIRNNTPFSGLMTSGALLSQSLFYAFSKYGECLVLSGVMATGYPQTFNA